MIPFSEDTCGSQNTIFFQVAILSSPVVTQAEMQNLESLFDKMNQMAPIPRTPLAIESIWEVSLRVH